MSLPSFQMVDFVSLGAILQNTRRIAILNYTSEDRNVYSSAPSCQRGFRPFFFIFSTVLAPSACLLNFFLAFEMVSMLSLLTIRCTEDL